MLVDVRLLLSSQYPELLSALAAGVDVANEECNFNAEKVRKITVLPREVRDGFRPNLVPT